MSKPNEQPDLALVEEYFSDRNLFVERFSDAEMQIGKTPDFRIRQDGVLVAYCEVKSPNDPWLDQQLDDAAPLTLVGGCRPDPIFNRLARFLRRADLQFSAVNADRTVLNILAYVNHDGASHYYDLVETITGHFHGNDGLRFQTAKHIAEGQIGYEKQRIDGFLWFEAETGRMTGAVLNQSDEKRKIQLCTLLGFDSTKIETSPT
jgi:hypothetical protein